MNSYHYANNLFCKNCKAQVKNATASDFTSVEWDGLLCHSCAVATNLPLHFVCAGCLRPITEDGLKALDQNWHVNCFRCAGPCGKQLCGTQFYERQGIAYCPQDYMAMFARFCAGCNTRITCNEMSAYGRAWHRGCFKCHQCQEPFKDSERFFPIDGLIKCEKCFNLPAPEEPHCSQQ